jgi:hypothetical protein
MISKRSAGIGLIVLSGLLWAVIPVVHFFHLSAWWTAAVDGALLIAAELAFWPGSVLLGASFQEKLKRWWNPRAWLKKP